MYIFNNKRGLLLIMFPATYAGFSLTMVIHAGKVSLGGFGGVGLQVLLGIIILVATFDVPPRLTAVLRTLSDKISLHFTGKNKG